MSHPDNVPSTSSAQRGFEVLDAEHLTGRVAGSVEPQQLRRGRRRQRAERGEGPGR